MFIGHVITKWIPGKKEMELKEDFCYLDSKGKIWKAPAGAIINGASIPRFFWRVAGAPYTGIYRRASVIHDHYYSAKTESKEDVDKMFYEAMMEDGFPKWMAKIFYLTVKYLGPSW